ncbi:MAG: DUF3857 and transglutaminase domain-containing protein [Verrucomicrobia bacterium]|nr:DUF3857 and transglutaminase domain-containing protein [Cytophagales bacterium]
MKVFTCFHTKVLALSILLLPFAVLAQKAPMKFGEVDAKQLAMKSYEKDPNAAAVILGDYGNTYFVYSDEGGFRYIFERHTRIKILRKEAYDKANVEIATYTSTGNSNKEKLTEIRGYTHNLEGGKAQKVKMEKSQVFETKYNKNYLITKFSLSNVKEGSVIEYSYTITSDFLFNLRSWTFQSDIPTVHSEYRVSVPEYFGYVQISQGYKPYDVNEKSSSAGSIASTSRDRDNPGSGFQRNETNYANNINIWVQKNVPAFKNEKFITTEEDYLVKMDFQLQSTNFPNSGYKSVLGTWEKLITDLEKEESFGGFINRRGPTKELVAVTIAGKTTPKDKMYGIYEYVRKKFRYDNRDGIYARKKIRELLDKPAGSSADINLLLINMLKEADLEVFPVISSTRRHGKVNESYPLVDRFNYVTAMVKLGEELHLLDATDPMRPVDMLAYDALNGNGLVMMPGGKYTWVSMMQAPRTANVTVGNYTILPEGEVKGTTTIQYKGYEALRLRKKLIKNPETVKIDLAQEDTTSLIKKKNEDDSELEKEIKKYTYKNITDFEKALEAATQVQTSEYSQVNGDFIYITPMLMHQTKENPFKQEERTFPVDFAHTRETGYYINYIIPEGYKIEELPKSARFAWGDGTVKYDFLVKAEENRIQLVSKFIIGKAVFEPEEYKDLRNLFGQVVSKHTEQIVLKKK